MLPRPPRRRAEPRRRTDRPGPGRLPPARPCGYKSARSPPPSRPPGTNSARPSTRPTSTAAAVALERAEKAIGISSRSNSGQRREDVEHEAPGRGRGVDLRPGRRRARASRTTSTSPFRQGAQAVVETRPVVAEAEGEVVVEVDRVVDAGRPQGVALQGPATGSRRSSRRGRSRATCVLRPWRETAGNVHAQITIRSISSTVTVSAVRS